MKTLVLIDGHALAYRMHFALERTGMSTRDKTPTWAVYGFFSAIFQLLSRIQPDALAMTFDKGRETFRTALYADYKAHREAMPDPLRTQLGIIHEGVERLGIPIFTLEGYEADDLIGTLCRQASGLPEPARVQILTGDQDSFQLVEDGKVEVLIPSRTPKEGLKVYNRDAVYEKLGVFPEQVVDFKALKGDTSDNIPGVPGIGDKTAAKLLTEYGTLENIYANIETLKPPKLKEKLETHREQAFMSQKLALINREAPIELDLAACHLEIPDMAALTEFLSRYEMKSFIAQAPTLLAPFQKPGQAVDAATTAPQAPAMSSDDDPALDFDFSGVSPTTGLGGFPRGFQMAAETAVLRTEAEFADWLKAVERVGVFAVDVETTSLSPLDAQPVGIALAVAPKGLVMAPFQTVNVLNLSEYPAEIPALESELPAGAPLTLKAAYVPVGHTDEAGHAAEGQLDWGTIRRLLKPLLAAEDVLKLVHNGKYEINCFRHWGMPLAGPIFDTMIASYVQSPERRHGLKLLSEDIFGHKMREFTDLVGTGKKAKPIQTLPIEEVAAYAMDDAAVTLQLGNYFAQTLNPKQRSLFYEVEMPLVAVLADVENTGVMLDTAYLKGLSGELDVRLAALEEEIHALAGLPFNINSPKQVGDVLFDRLGIKPLKKTASKSGYSTDAKVLEALAGEHPIVQKLLDYRQLFKLKSTYIDNLPTLIHPDTGRVHTSFNQTVTATGRLSSSDPNLQNIPIRSDVGRLIRQAFIPCDREDWVLLSADYSQIELRLLAHFSEDPHLLEAFNHHIDVHTATAALVFGVPTDEVTKEMRYRAKTVNFGIIYGQTAHGLSQQLGIERYEAQQFIDKYFLQYGRVRGFIESVKKQAHVTGQVETLCLRTRDLSEGLNSSVRTIREFSERAAFNTPLQGSAADLVKVAMTRLWVKLREEKLKARLILQVHDEVVLEVPRSEIDAAIRWTRWAMELGQPLRVPLEVDIHVGDTWMET
jgi:DNA polymerase-1